MKGLKDMKFQNGQNKRPVKRMAAGLIVVLATAFYAGNHIYQRPHIKQSRFAFSIGEAIPTDSQTYLSYGSQYEDVEFDPQLFAMKDIGEYDVEVEFARERFTLHIAIVDDQPPVITFSSQNSITIYEYHDNIIINGLWQVEDESEVTIEVQPAVSEIKEGAQEICVKATDISENTDTKCKTVTVNKQPLILPDIPDVHSVQELVDTYIRQKGLSPSTFAFFYVSVGDKETYRYNEDRLIYAASTIKVPLNMLYEDAYTQGTKHPQDTIVFIKSDIEEGGGDTLKSHRVGEALAYAYLQQQSIENSDNTATNMLVRGLGGFRQFRNQIARYSTQTMPNGFYTQNVVTMNYMCDVMNTLYEKRDHYANVIKYMQHAAEGSFLQASTDVFTIAQKYGQFEENLHAVGIVYTPQPYLVGIYTMNRVDGEAIIEELNQWLIAYQLLKV